MSTYSALNPHYQADVTDSHRGAVVADLTFIVPSPDGSAPFVTEGPEGDEISETKTHQVRVDDIRGREHMYNLDTNAFQVLQNVSSEATYETFDTIDEIQRVYYPEVQRLLLENVPGAQRVKIMGHSVRKESSDKHRNPILFVHSDHTEQVAEKFAKEYADSEKAEELLNGRWRIVNVWRPLNGPVQTTPMTFASASSLSEDDLFNVEVRMPDRLDWFMGLKYNPTQRWCYWSEMENSERLLLKCTDSAQGVGKHAFHSAFVDPRAPLDAKPRESIEVRTLVFS